MKKLIFIFIFLIQNAYSDVISINNQKLDELLKKGIPIIDVRTEKEWNKTGIIKNSFLVSMINKRGRYSFSDWMKRFSDINLKNNSAILICAVGGRSLYLAKMIQSVTDDLRIYNVEKGIHDWIINKKPIVKVDGN